ncbi:death-associated kinase 1 isoform X1, partial [Brachionus plicatilis]
ITKQRSQKVSSQHNGESALHIACKQNLLPVVQTMCSLGCRVDVKNKNEMTPLHTATERNDIDAVRCLCLAGLDFNIKNKDGYTAEQLAINLKHSHIANLLNSLRRKKHGSMQKDRSMFRSKRNVALININQAVLIIPKKLRYKRKKKRVARKNIFEKKILFLVLSFNQIIFNILNTAKKFKKHLIEFQIINKIKRKIFPTNFFINFNIK